jgi:hypothetical protein
MRKWTMRGVSLWLTAIVLGATVGVFASSSPATAAEAKSVATVHDATSNRPCLEWGEISFIEFHIEGTDAYYHNCTQNWLMVYVDLYWPLGDTIACIPPWADSYLTFSFMVKSALAIAWHCV